MATLEDASHQHSPPGNGGHSLPPAVQFDAFSFACSREIVADVGARCDQRPCTAGHRTLWRGRERGGEGGRLLPHERSHDGQSAQRIVCN